ncbi:hypothetical protein DL98DRAFT_196198 [Cadophora sp. DSE1049]|nr:hypothetical protein DL98DRAFT_196198 [Cadophora sp. DSE1049]
MGSLTMPFRPFSFQPNDSTNSLSRRDKEVSISPDTSPPPPRFTDNYEGKDKPSVPNRNPRRSQIWIDANTSREKVNQGISAPAPQTVGSCRQPIPSPRSPTFQLQPSPRSFAFGKQSPSPTRTPPMTKSSQKILQLTGFDPRFERALPIEHQQLSPTQKARPLLPQSPIRTISSNSSGSFYSQAEVGFRYEQAGSPKNSSTSIAQSSQSEGEYLTSSIYNISEHSSKASNISRPNTKTKLSNEQTVQPSPPPQPASETESQAQRQSEDEPLPLPSFPTSVHSRDSNEITTLPEILAQERLRYDKGSEKDTSSAYRTSISMTPALVPSPLSMTSKTPNRKAKERIKPKHITATKDKNPSLFRAARDSLDWGIYDPSTSSSPSKSKHMTTPVSPMFTMESDHLTLSPPLGSPLPETPKSASKRKRFGAGAKHPLKSPFPFHARGGSIVEEDEEADSMPSPSTSRAFKRRVSSTIKHLSPTSSSSKSRSSPPSSNKYVITNSARRADGPATPMPPKHGFMEGVMRGKEVLEKVGKSVVGASKEEKRRESLKKRIVVVGITDQSPDGRVAEWL